ncbi:DEAD/DEAH box helicase family protein [Amphritea sp. 1_MG-2023]|uniref:DEAD/DEAH box helicase family protein n=1 Tax=Amphritea sp. 1_MG-2023 TaxID=3062670 RepID=UPI0026E413DA|nr:DEAD/DEAH box helicase family protein [Amphritea sp. 1_MG-2023]MDO6563287.1 DEAD/DEAH box helicase family protein [Amphritea sp. 1_MG-2023]
MSSPSYLLTGADGQQLLPALRCALTHATEIEIAVSFIRASGLKLIFGDLEAALQSTTRDVRLTLLTSDYLCITDPSALKMLMLLVERGADIRIFETGSTDSFHLKAYIFARSKQGELINADAFIGSSNISAKALTDGLEWNYHLDYPNAADSLAAQRLNEVRQQFQQLLLRPQIRALNFDWIENYQRRYEQARKVVPLQSAMIDQQEPEPAAPTPTAHQAEALHALLTARQQGWQKGLVVLATGMGKTYLAAFDAAQLSAERVLFVAHREEILLQAEATFLAVLPHKRVGRFSGKQKDERCDLLFASVQTLGRMANLERFTSDSFDYIVIDEFHHAAAGSYQRLLTYFKPQFMLGLTATPDRTDGADILRLCDHKLIYRRDLFDAINAQQLCPFSYYGIFDSAVNYEHIPWRNGRFDPTKLSTQLATRGRCRHILKEWRDKSQSRTLAFCASRRHADYMAGYFKQQGIRAASVHSESSLTRSAALESLERGQLQVLFAVDLFNEGVDLPQIDTVMMLRPTESNILFLQQLGRGLRLSPGKDSLAVLDFVGNHHSFLNRPEMLFGSLFPDKPTRQQLANAAKQANDLLPDGCYANYDLAFIEFLDSLVMSKLDKQYADLKLSLKRRPTLKEFWLSGANLTQLRRNYGCWWEFIDAQGDASNDELQLLEQYVQWYRDLTLTKTSKSYKLILLQTLLEHQALTQPTVLSQLAAWAKQWFLQHPEWLKDLPSSLQPLDGVSNKVWLNHWRKMPIHHWCTAEQTSKIKWFAQDDMLFRYQPSLSAAELPTFSAMTDEILTWRLAQYAQSKQGLIETDTPALTEAASTNTQLPFFPNIKIACGHFKTGYADIEDALPAPSGFGRLSPDRHFIAQASGDSMNGGKHPIQDGDYLLLEQITPQSAGSISNQTVAIERQDSAGDNQYLLRKVIKNAQGGYTLRANNPDYADLSADDSMTSFARLKGILDPSTLFAEPSSR